MAKKKKRPVVDAASASKEQLGLGMTALHMMLEHFGGEFKVSKAQWDLILASKGTSYISFDPIDGGPDYMVRLRHDHDL